MIDYNVRAERMGWLPSGAAAADQPDPGGADAAAAGGGSKGLRGQGAQGGALEMSCEIPTTANWPRNMFVWRSNLLSAPRQGPRVLPQAPAGHQQRRAGQGSAATTPSPPRWSGTTRRPRQARPAGDARLPHEHDLPVLGHRAAHRHLVREERPQHQRHAPFIHPLSAAVDPAWQSRSDWEIYKGFAKKFSEVCVGHLGVEPELVLTPLMHDSPGELAQPIRREGLEEGRGAT